MEIGDTHPFPTDDIREAIRETVAAVIPAGTEFQNTRLDYWSTAVTEGILKKLTTLQQNFKFIVTCHIVQNIGAGLHTASVSLWDRQTDGYVTETIGGDTDSVHCIATVYGLSV
ncbi:putative Dynein molecular motor protein light chain 1 [Paratrimastix pyriformis]|uniref:Dynein molecular motor protein light chain 1 n=1 Tax=Paratrimastix pyriformis TaxID=342808 RepID=A0ABQ8U5J6_9EUKA|nr:putative Dynein molecular motor protein light chain 1 [Paratrimastix pyriformis]